MLTQRYIMSPMSSCMPKTHPNSHTTIQSIVLLLIPLPSQIHSFIHLFLHEFIHLFICFFSYAWNTPKLPHTRASMCTRRRKWYEWHEAITAKLTLRRPVWKLSGTVLQSVLNWGYVRAWQTEQGTSLGEKAEMEEGTLPLELSFLEFR